MAAMIFWYAPHRQMLPVIAASMPLMVAYPFAVAWVSERSGRLARERKKAVEQTAQLREHVVGRIIDHPEELQVEVVEVS